MWEITEHKRSDKQCKAPKKPLIWCWNENSSSLALPCWILLVHRGVSSAAVCSPTRCIWHKWAVKHFARMELCSPACCNLPPEQRCWGGGKAGLRDPRAFVLSISCLVSCIPLYQKIFYAELILLWGKISGAVTLPAVFEIWIRNSQFINKSTLTFTEVVWRIWVQQYKHLLTSCSQLIKLQLLSLLIRSQLSFVLPTFVQTFNICRCNLHASVNTSTEGSTCLGNKIRRCSLHLLLGFSCHGGTGSQDS